MTDPTACTGSIVDAVVRIVETSQFTFTNEAALRDQLAGLLASEGFPAVTEARCGTGRLDIKVGRVGIECKIAGSVTALRRQISRYANTGDLDAIVVATTRGTHRQTHRPHAETPIHVALAWTGAL